jgi:hypothetical protein|nr:MAG TPA: 23S rRNA-specific endonuclease [Caudoviricetes sp.]
MIEHLSNKKVVLDTCFIGALLNRQHSHHRRANEIYDTLTDKSHSVQIMIPTIVLAEMSGLGLEENAVNDFLKSGHFQIKAHTSRPAYDTKPVMGILKSCGRSEYKRNRNSNDYGKKWDEFTDDIKIITIAKNIGADYILTFDKFFIESSAELNAAGYYETKAVDISTNEGLAELNGGQSSLPFNDEL